MMMMHQDDEDMTSPSSTATTLSLQDESSIPSSPINKKNGRMTSVSSSMNNAPSMSSLQRDGDDVEKADSKVSVSSPPSMDISQIKHNNTDPVEEEEESSMYSSDIEECCQNNVEEDEASAYESDHNQSNRPSIKHQAAREERNRLGKKETRAIWCLRLIVVLLLFVFGLTIASAMYFWVSDAEQDTFETNFGFYSKLVYERFNTALANKLKATDSLGVTITSHALNQGETFPFVTVPDFEYHGSNTRITGDTVMTYYLPYITSDNREEWEAYSRNNSMHLVEAWKEEQTQKRIQDKIYGYAKPDIDGIAGDALESGQLSDGQRVPPGRIWFPADGVNNPYTSDKIETLEPPYFPVWQLTPLLPPNVDMINLDFSKYDFLGGAINNTLNTGLASIDIVVDLMTNNDDDDNNEDAATFDLLIQSGQYRHKHEHYEGDPLSALVYPVFDTLGAVADDPNIINPTNKNTKKKNVVGVLFLTLYWRFLLSDILPPDIEGVVCVLKNSLGQYFTYQINGEEAIYLGQGDLHDPKYDDYLKFIDIAEYMAGSAGPDTRSFTAVDLSDDYLKYKLSIYPSEAFESLYVTQEAANEAIGVAVIFGVVILIFLIYDCCVSRRQRIVMDRAVKATAVVSSLYPATVREQIIECESNDVVKRRFNSNASKRNSNSNNRQTAFLKRSLPHSVQDDQNNRTGTLIASKHRNCTVYFADLAGFTRWSSTREPEQVFHLLEALFKRFDDAAHRRGVFKVETIGDCYMAVTGLPLEQPDHAVRMAKFANDCQQKLEQVTAELASTLGEGTDALALRTGMHSGEVTAGVLRGEKGRFQLFGDTVNTASRMESTGVPRKIQLSQTTADCLISAGKEGWLIPRREKVEAKGKGAMQTYFLYIKSDRSEKTSISSTTASQRQQAALSSSQNLDNTKMLSQ